MRHKHGGIALPWDGMLAPHTRGNLLFATSQANQLTPTAILAPRGGWSCGKMVAVRSKDMETKRTRPRLVMSIVATNRAEWVGIFAMVECGDQVMQRRSLGSPKDSHRTIIHINTAPRILITWAMLVDKEQSTGQIEPGKGCNMVLSVTMRN
jgi:hypothetical protein